MPDLADADFLVATGWAEAAAAPLAGDASARSYQRLTRADGVVWLDYSTKLCLGRALKRWWSYRGTARPDMTEGCPERLDLEFLHYILTFRRNWQARNAAALAGFGGEIVRFTSPAEAECWLALQ